MGDLLGSLVQESKKRTILCHWGWVVTNGIKAIAEPEMEKRAQAHESHQWALAGTLRIE